MPLDAISRVSHLDIVVVEPRTGVVAACSYFHGGTAGAQLNAKLHIYIYANSRNSTNQGAEKKERRSAVQ